MKPVGIFRHSPGEGPGYFATFLDANSVPWTLVSVDTGAPIPVDASGFSGLCFMGGPMSVNDALPWLPPTFALIRNAVARDVPVIGHCLGGQLMSKALGGTVTRNPVKEIGWGKVSRIVSRGETPADMAAAWLGDFQAFEAFHWHGETFSVPPGATRILASEWCENQAFVLGLHLGMQCHVEMTEAMIRLWNRAWGDENTTPGPSVQRPEEMYETLDARIAAMRRAADRLYGRWITGLKD